jgi:hypothetical protein
MVMLSLRGVSSREPPQLLITTHPPLPWNFSNCPSSQPLFLPLSLFFSLSFGRSRRNITKHTHTLSSFVVYPYR